MNKRYGTFLPNATRLLAAVFFNLVMSLPFQFQRLVFRFLYDPDFYLKSCVRESRIRPASFNSEI